LIGLGVAGALIVGLKSIVLWFPKERLPLLNGCFIMLGTVGALTATVPAELVVAWIGWRALFAALAAATVVCAALIVFLSPEPTGERAQAGLGLASLKAIYSDQRFWRLAPVSTLCISTAWALQGLWAGPWLADVEYFPSEIAGQASAALNILHISGAFVLQYAIGIVIDIWGSKGGHYPPAAYQTAFAIILSFQLMALIWFLASELSAVQSSRTWIKDSL